MSTQLLILPLQNGVNELVFGKTLTASFKVDGPILVPSLETMTLLYYPPVKLQAVALAAVMLDVLQQPGFHLALTEVNEDHVAVAVTCLAKSPGANAPTSVTLIALPTATFRGRETEKVVRYEEVMTPHPAPETLLENPKSKKPTKRTKK